MSDGGNIEFTEGPVVKFVPAQYLHEANERIARLERQVGEAANLYAQAQMRISELEADRDKFVELVQKDTQRYAALAQEMGFLRDDVAHRTRNMHELAKQLAVATTSATNWKRRVEELEAELSRRDQQIVTLANQADEYDILHRKAIAKTEEARTALQASRDDFLLVTEQLAAAIKDNDEKERLLVEAGYRVAQLEAEIKSIPQTFVDWRDAQLKEREHICELEAERERLRHALLGVQRMIKIMPGMKLEDLEDKHINAALAGEVPAP